MIKFIFGMQVNVEVFYKFILLFWVCVVRHTQSAKIRSLDISVISPKKHGGCWFFFFFCLQIKTIVFYNLIVSLRVCVAWHAQSTENIKFALSLQYFKEKIKDGGDFLPADKHQRFLQINTIILVVCGQACPDYSK